MADNPFSVQVPDIYKALLAGRESYNTEFERAKQNEREAAFKQIGQQIQQGGLNNNALGQLFGQGVPAAPMLNAAGNILYHQATGQHQAGTLAENIRHNKATETAEQNKPVPGSQYGLYNRAGNQIVAPPQDSLLDDETLAHLAEQYRQGDTSVFTNVGRGAQGAQNVVRLRKVIAEQNKNAGVSGADQAANIAQFGGDKAALRTNATRQAAVEFAGNTANKAIDIADVAMSKLPRTDFLPVNKLIQAWQTNTGSPDQAAAGAAVNTLVNEYARVVSPTGVPTDETRKRANEMLNTAQNHEQFRAVTQIMRQEIEVAKKAAKETRQELKGLITGKKPEEKPKTDPLGIR